MADRPHGQKIHWPARQSREAAEREVARLLAAAPAAPAPRFSSESLQGLPEPVARYFRFALTPDQPLVRWARIRQTGTFRAGGFDAPWSPFTAVQHITTQPPGYIWDANIHMVPLLPVRVRDSYLGGRGAMQGRLAALIPVVDQSGSPELAAGALHRYLAEAVWWPTTLLPGQGVSWEPVDAKTARATLTDGATSVSLEFQFGEQGEIVRAYTPERYRDVKGAGVPTPWTGDYSDYTQREGMRTPMRGEVAWILPEGRLSYCRLHVPRIEYGWQPIDEETGLRVQ
ncbi:MAG TPA: DUF6544 family protein [Chthonomonadaceae bacterium]|nr:DUF6544 family protein [Chthonomonadaceae bacterium]